MVQFDNTYARLPDRFFSRVEPEPVPEPQTLRVNAGLARQLGFDPEWLASDEGADFAVGNELLDGSEPIAQAYAGHQFGGWVPQLGDGRAVLLGEVLTESGERFDVQLKGSGRTPFSRRGDGRAPLGPVLREYLVSEAMHALGIPTTRSLVAAATGAPVRRESVLPGGVLVRVARSHIRIGTFEFFAGRADYDGIATLARYVIERHYPDLESNTADAPLDLLDAYAGRLASLVAKWQAVGFIHGVLNTDNMLLSGETIDYGPCAFMNQYDPQTVYSSIDRMGRYAYGNQPAIAQWNLTRLAEALLRADDPTEERIARAQGIIDAFPARFREAYGTALAAKVGLSEVDEETWQLLDGLLEQMDESNADFTLTFLQLAEEIAPTDEPTGNLPDGFDSWLERWRGLIAREGVTDDEVVARMRAVNPVVIPRNHEVERAIESAVNDGDLEPFHNLADALTSPFAWPNQTELTQPPAPGEEIEATFCGT